MSMYSINHRIKWLFIGLGFLFMCIWAESEFRVEVQQELRKEMDSRYRDNNESMTNLIKSTPYRNEIMNACYKGK